MTIAHLYALLVASLPALLAFTAITTAANQFAQRFLAARMPRTAHVINTLCVDYVRAVQAIASFAKTPPRGMIRGDALIAVALLAAATLAPLGIALGCGALQAAARDASTVLTTADAIGRGLSQVVAWCRANGVDAQLVANAERAIADKDYHSAIVITESIVAKARVNSADIPEAMEVTLRLAEGAIASESIAAGMRALSTDAGAP